MIETYLDDVIHFETESEDAMNVLPDGWTEVIHTSGMPVFFHHSTRVCSFSRPFFIPEASLPRHLVPKWSERTNFRRKEKPELHEDQTHDLPSNLQSDVQSTSPLYSNETPRSSPPTVCLSPVNKTSVTILHEYVKKVMKTSVLYDYMVINRSRSFYRCEAKVLTANPVLYFQNSSKVKRRPLQVINENQSLNLQSISDSGHILIGIGFGESKDDSKLAAAVNALNNLVPGLTFDDEQVAISDDREEVQEERQESVMETDQVLGLTFSNPSSYRFDEAATKIQAWWRGILFRQQNYKSMSLLSYRNSIRPTRNNVVKIRDCVELLSSSIMEDRLTAACFLNRLVGHYNYPQALTSFVNQGGIPALLQASHSLHRAYHDVVLQKELTQLQLNAIQNVPSSLMMPFMNNFIKRVVFTFRQFKPVGAVVEKGRLAIFETTVKVLLHASMNDDALRSMNQERLHYDLNRLLKRKLPAGIEWTLFSIRQLREALTD